MTNLSPSLPLAHPPVVTRNGNGARGPAVLFAITEREEEIFFGRTGGTARVAGARPHRTRQEGWRETLEEFRPEVLVSCWSTPPLPAAWLEDTRCSLRYVCHLTGAVRELVGK